MKHDPGLLRALAQRCLEAKDGSDELDVAVTQATYGPSHPGLPATSDLGWTKTAITDHLPGWNYAFAMRGGNQPFAYVNNNTLHFVGVGGSRVNPDYRWFERTAATPELAGTAVLLLALADRAELTAPQRDETQA